MFIIKWFGYVLFMYREIYDLSFMYIGNKLLFKYLCVYNDLIV